MNIIGFIESQYPIRNKVKVRLEDPYKRIAEMDDLPYDTIGPDEGGVITKLVEVNSERFISVMDLIGMERKDIVASGDEDLLCVWDAYMSQIDLEDLNIADMMECVKQHQSIMKEREEKLSVLSL